MAKTSTQRVQEHRKRKKIAEIKTKSRWLVWALQDFYRREELKITTWIQASDLYYAALTDERVEIMTVFFPNQEDFIKNLTDAGIAKAWMKQGSEEVLLIRPRWLGQDVL